MFFIHCDFLKRDIVTSLIIKKYIDENTNTSAYITSRINTRILFSRFYNHIWVLNTDMYFYLLKNESKKIKKSNIIIYEQEGFVGEEARSVMFNNGKDLEYADKIIVWGKKSYNHLVEKMGLPCSKIAIGGLYRLLNCRHKENNIIKNIGIVTRHTTLKREITHDIIEKIYEEKTSSNNELFSFTSAMQRSLLELNSLFSNLASLGNKFNFSFRLHPMENRDVYSFLDSYENYSIDNKTDFGSWVNEIDAVISPPSSSVFECIAAKKPVFYVNDDNSIVPNSNDLSYKIFYNYAFNIKDLEKSRDKVFRLNDNVKEFIDEYYNSFNCDFTSFNNPKNEQSINKIYLKTLDLMIHIYMLRNTKMLDFSSNYSSFFSKLNISKTNIDKLNLSNEKVSVW